MAETWLDVMPVIPLARGVPLVLRHQHGLTNLWSVEALPVPSDDRDWRVDLGDPQGFGYALRWLALHRGLLGDNLGSRMYERHLLGGATDADRLALARACAEVVS